MSKMKLNPFASALLARRWPFAALSLIAPGLALAAPSGGNVVAGQATISAAGNTTTIQQLSHQAVIDWQEFSIGGNEYVTFNQSSASAAVLNKVVGGSPSEILGNLSANGRVYLVNPQGVLFGQGSQVNVGSLVATTMDIATEDFMQGRYVLRNPGAGDVTNLGRITTAEGGYVVLAGDYVQNSGVITAQLGEVALVSGNAVTLDIGNDGLINLSIDEASLAARAGAANAGQILAQGGRVLMTAKVARELAQAAVNNSGTIRAQGISEQGGDIYLVAQGGDIANDGLIDASGTGGGNGGGVLIQGDGDITLGAGSTIDIGGANGGAARIIASGRLTTSAGSLVDGRADDQSIGRGGFTELSGHTGVQLDGSTLLGQGGQLLIDPATICISGSSGCSGVGFDSTVQEADIESSLNYGTDVFIVASDSIAVSDSLVGGAINSDSSANLLLGIGTIEGYGGPFTGGFGQSPLTPLPGNGFFVNGSASTNGTGAIQFQGTSATRDGIAIGGHVTLKGALNKGDVTVGNITAGSVEVKSAGAIFLGDVTADAGDIFLSSKVALGVGNLTTTSEDAGITLRVLHSDTGSSIGNLTASGDYGGICINSNSCDEGYHPFAGVQFDGYGDPITPITPANIDLGSTARTWAADDVQIDNATIIGNSLAINAISDESFRYVSIGLAAGATIDTGSLSLTTSAVEDYNSQLYISGATISADALVINAGQFNIAEGSSFSGNTASITLTHNSYGYIYGASFDYSQSISLQAAGDGDLDIADTHFNAGLQVTQPGLITGHNVTISAADLTLSQGSTIQAGTLQLTATGGELYIHGGSQLTFNTGTLTAIAGEIEERQVVAAFTEIGGGETEPPYNGFDDVFNGAVSLGDYSATPDRLDAVLNYSTLTINAAEGMSYIDNATLAGGALTVNASSLHVQNSTLTGSNADFIITGIGLSDVSGDNLYYEESDVDSSSFDFTGRLNISVANGRHLDLDTLDINADDTPSATGRTVSFSAADLTAAGLVVYADSVNLTANGGHLEVLDSSFNVPLTDPPAALPASSIISLNGGTIVLNDVSAHARTINVVSTLELAEVDPQTPEQSFINGSFIFNSDLHFDQFTGTSANLFDIASSTFEGNSVTITANGVPQFFDESQALVFDTVSSFISDSTFDLSGSFTLTASDGVMFSGGGSISGGDAAALATAATGGNSITARNVVVSAGTTLQIIGTTFLGVEEANVVSSAAFNAASASGGGSTDAILASGSVIGFNGNVLLNGADGDISFQSTAVAGSAVTIHADHSVRIDSSSAIAGLSSLIMTAGVGTDLGRNQDSEVVESKLYLDGSVEGGMVNLIGLDGVVNDGELALRARALNVAGQHIDLRGSSITIGNGLALVPASDADPLLLPVLAASDPAFPRPASSGPNAFFKAIDEVLLGDVTFSQTGGDYLFVRGSNVGFNELSFLDQLLFQFTPTDPAAGLELADLGFGNAPEGLIFAFGSSGYLGNIEINRPLSAGTTNFIFATRGSVTGEETISTNGRVVVLDFAAVGGSAAENASKAINQVNSSNQPAAGSGSTSPDPQGSGDDEDGGDSSLVTEESGGTSGTGVQEEGGDEANQCT